MLQIIPEKKNTKLVITLIVIFVALAVFIIFLPSILSSVGIKLVNIVTYAFILVEYILLLSAFLLLERYILFKVRYVIKVNVDRLDDDGVAGEYEPAPEVQPACEVAFANAGDRLGLLEHRAGEKSVTLGVIIIIRQRCHVFRILT